MIRWKLKETLESCGVTRYALQKETGIALNTIKDMYSGKTQRPDLELLNKIITTLRKKTQRRIALNDLLEYIED